jgi:hypothetical protein
MAGLSTASARECTQTLSEAGDSSRSTAHQLINYVEQHWEIAIREKPDRISVSVVDDPSGDGTKIDFYRAQFKNFQADFYRYPNGTPMPSELSTTSPSFKLPCGLRMGQSKAKVKAAIGSPTYTQAESFIYATGGDQNGEVILRFTHGKLRYVAWQYDMH